MIGLATGEVSNLEFVARKPAASRPDSSEKLEGSLYRSNGKSRFVLLFFRFFLKENEGGSWGFSLDLIPMFLDFL